MYARLVEHHCFLVIDHQTIFTCSGNWTVALTNFTFNQSAHQQTLEACTSSNYMYISIQVKNISTVTPNCNALTGLS